MPAGKTPTQIAYELNADSIPTPGMYNRQKGLWPDTIKTKESEQLWKSSRVCHILGRYEYTGAFVAGRYEALRTGSRRRKKKPRKDWTIVEGVNPPLVLKEDFETARGVVKTPKPSDYIMRRNYALKGKVKCWNCGRTMAYDDSGYGSRYSCAAGVNAGKFSKCTKEKVPAVKIEGSVRYAVWLFCTKIMDVNEKAAKRPKSVGKSTEEVKRQMKMLKEERLQKYELYADGRLSREDYIREKKELTEKIEELQVKKMEIEAGNAKAALADAERQELETLAGKAEQFLEEDDLSAEMVEDMVKEVRVYDSKRIEVELNHVDVVEKFAAECSVNIAAG